MMFDFIKGFPAQLNEALRIGEKAVLKNRRTRINNIVVSGLGGSGIGGNLVSELVSDELQVPLIANKSYTLPAFVDAHTLLVLSSYSGNTEETISVASLALKKSLKPIVITAGGKLLKIAQTNKLDHIAIPSGFPPRTCLGYSAVQLLYVLHQNGLITAKFKKQIKQTADLLAKEQKAMMKAAEEMAAKIYNKSVIIYAEDKIESTALRLKQQLNENAKMYCWYHVIPEMNHNELVGWREKNDQWAVLWLRHNKEHKRNAFRASMNIQLKKKFTDHLYEIEAKGKTTFEKHFYLIHFGDWLSYYLAVKRNYDPMEIDVLNELKSNLSKLK